VGQNNQVEDSMRADHERGVVRPLLGGITALVVAMGVGRFAYTPLLPVMQREFGIDAALGGAIASLNALGYLLGALLCVWLPIGNRRAVLIHTSLVVSLATTAAMALSASPFVWGALRLISGVATAGVLVPVSALVLQTLAAHPLAWLPGLLFSGVGLGIALSGILTLYWDNTRSSGEMWLGLALVCLPLAAVSWCLVREPRPASQTTAPQERAVVPYARQLLACLLFAYFCEGLGYIVSGTFLVVLVREALGSAAAGSLSWIVVGLAAALLTPFWPLAAARVGAVRALVAAHLLQAAGIVLPVLWEHVATAIVGAILFGATFLSIAMLSLNLGRTLAPHRSTPVIALLTVAFGLGQISGPLLAGILAAHTAGFAVPLIAAASVVAIGGTALAIAASIWADPQHRVAPTSNDAHVQVSNNRSS
jgi:predicted MFS family arabinose efflux permease